MAPIVGQNIDNSVIVEGYEPAIWSHGSIERKQTVSFGIKQWQAIGGQSANTYQGMRYLLKQVEELASNRDQQPVYIQWTASADPAAILNATEYHDGWYYIDDFEPDYSKNVVTGLVQCRMTVTQVGAAAPRRVSMSYSGGALSTNYSGTATNLIAAPVGSTLFEANFNRTGGEGAIPCMVSPVESPANLTLSATLSNIFKGGVHVYDTINTGSNAVPSAASGLFVNANWVEVFYTDHDFQGDCVVTNGLQLLLFAVGTNQICTAYLWNTAAANVGWQQYATVDYNDNAGRAAPLKQYSLVRIGPEECAIATIAATSGPNAALLSIRLQRGRYEARADLRPLTEITTGTGSLEFVVPFTAAKILYNSAHIDDNALAEGSPAVPTDYGYGCGFLNSTSFPFILGFLYQNQPGNSQPQNNSGNNVGINLGDTTSLAVNAQRSYGFFAIPYGSQIAGSVSPANLQAEAESGTLDAGWSIVTTSGESASSAAKCASGTVATHADVFGTAFIPVAGTYDVWFRMKVTTNVGSAAEMTVGLWDSDSAAFVASGSTTFNRTALTTGYLWYRAATAVTPTAGHNMRFRAVTALTLGTDWFVDEACMVPKTLTAANTGPQDIYQQWAWDDSNRALIRP